MGVDWLAYGYGCLVASGGIIGYAKAGMLFIKEIVPFFALINNWEFVYLSFKKLEFM